MIIILPEDADKITEQLRSVIRALGSGVANRIDNDILLGEDYSPMKVVGYWVGDLLRIDIKIKQ